MSKNAVSAVPVSSVSAETLVRRGAKINYSLRERTLSATFLLEIISIASNISVVFGTQCICVKIQSNLPKWTPLKWITCLNGYHLSGQVLT